jgi:hypothetical protein
LFEEADRAAEVLRKRPGFSEADLQLMFRHLQKRWHPAAAMYACATGREGPSPPAAADSWT